MSNILTDTTLWTALITPMDQNGVIQQSDLIRLLREQEFAGNGVILLGSTGESLQLSSAERKRVVNLAISAQIKVPILVGVGGHDLQSCTEWVKWLETKAINGYLMVTPIYSKPGEEGQFRWFQTLLDTATRPCVLYNVPGRTAISLNEKSVGRLSHHPNFIGIKESSGSVDRMMVYRDVARNQHILCGDDPLMAEFSLNGGTGLVSVASNVWLSETKAYVHLALEDKLTFQDVALWKKASNALFLAANPIPVKALLASESRISTNQVRLPLHSADFIELEALKNWSSKIRLWYENCRYSGRLTDTYTPITGQAS
jgi:4-hydroxy-tetrahydrodipicolinate synthase